MWGGNQVRRKSQLSDCVRLQRLRLALLNYVIVYFNIMET